MALLVKNMFVFNGVTLFCCHGVHFYGDVFNVGVLLGSHVRYACEPAAVLLSCPVYFTCLLWRVGVLCNEPAGVLLFSEVEIFWRKML